MTKPDVLRVLGLGHQSLQPEVLLLQLFEPLGLVHPHPAVFLAPTVESLLGDPNLLDCLRGRFAFALGHLDLSQLADNLFRGVSFLCHGYLPTTSSY